MTHKVRCTVTGNLIYMTPQRYARVLAKYGSEEAIKAKYVSMVGKKVHEGVLDVPTDIHNRIRCSISGLWCYITNQRILAGVKKYGSWDELCKHYMSRSTKRLLREGKTADEIRNWKTENDIQFVT